MAFVFLFGGSGHLLILYLGGDGHLFFFLFVRNGHLFIFLLGGAGHLLIILFIWEGMFGTWEGIATYYFFYLGGMATYLFLYLGGDGQLSVLLLGRGWPCICFFFFGEIACCQDFQFLLTPRTPSLNIQFLFLIKNTGPPYQNTKNTQPQYSFFCFV